MARDDEVRLIAYNLWEEEGCVNGRDCEHWYQAEAIWEQQQKPALRSNRTATKRSTPKSPKALPTRKRSPKA